MLLPGPVFRREVGAAIQVRRSILRKRALSLEPADEFEVAVVAALGAAVRALVRGRLTLQSTLGLIETAASRLRDRCRGSRVGDRALLAGAGLLRRQGGSA